MAEEDVTITEKELDALKNDSLKENIEEISTQLGDPGRYFASFKAKDILDQSDCELIKSQVTSIEKATAFIDAISGRKGRKGEHPYDVFVGALKRMKVHIHVVRILNQALAKKRAELKTIKRADLPVTTETGATVHDPSSIVNGFPSNGTILNRGALPTIATTSTTSSPTSSSASSSSVYATTPPSYVTSPLCNETDYSLVSPQSSYVSEFPRIPARYNEHGEMATPEVSMSTTEESITNPSSSDVSSGPIPSLPSGFNSDGSRRESVSKLINQSHNEHIHPDAGPLPPAPPPYSSVQHQPSGPSVDQVPYHRNFTSPVSKEDTLLASLRERIHLLEEDNIRFSTSFETQQIEFEEHYKHLEDELRRVARERDRLLGDKDILVTEKERVIAINRHLESQISVLRQSGRGKPVGTPISTPSRLLSPNYLASSNGSIVHVPPKDSRRTTEPYLKDPKFFANQYHHTSEPILKFTPHSSVARPNNLPLGIVDTTQQMPSYQDTPFPPDMRRPTRTHQSPGSDSSQDGGIVHSYHKVSMSADDLTSGGEDQNSVRSFGSNHSGGKINFELSGVNNTRSTVV